MKQLKTIPGSWKTCKQTALLRHIPAFPKVLRTPKREFQTIHPILPTYWDSFPNPSFPGEHVVLSGTSQAWHNNGSAKVGVRGQVLGRRNWQSRAFSLTYLLKDSTYRKVCAFYRLSSFVPWQWILLSWQTRFYVTNRKVGIVCSKSHLICHILLHQNTAGWISNVPKLYQKIYD